MKKLLILLRKTFLRILVFLVGLGGPALTFVLYLSGENWDVDPTERLMLMKEIFVGYIVSVVIATVVHFLIKNLWICILISTGICLFVYLILSMFFVFDLSDPEEQMWLMVGLIFICVNYFPMAVSASGSTILQIRFNALFKESDKWMKFLFY